jgi:hypothetical protein
MCGKGILNQYNSGRRYKTKRNLEGERGESERNTDRQLREAKETKTNIRKRELVKTTQQKGRKIKKLRSARKEKQK